MSAQLAFQLIQRMAATASPAERAALAGEARRIIAGLLEGGALSPDDVATMQAAVQLVDDCLAQRTLH